MLDEHEAADIATILELLSLDDAVALIGMIDDLGGRGRIFDYLPARRQIAIAASLDRTPLAELVASMPHDERADLFKRLTQAQQEMLLPGLALAERDDVRTLAAYGEGTSSICTDSCTGPTAT